ncbi:MAG: hypothetical protein HY769_10435 [Candidatus Stahlbacteria bacterium]|nr:hypothetical protein [Candidatus Stahlbacteria bacterium]
MENREYIGLCSTCKNVSTCMYIGISGQPVLECEEFESCIASPIKTTIKSSSIVNKPNPVKYDICINCENQEDCSFIKPETNLLYCEEHR